MMYFGFGNFTKYVFGIRTTNSPEELRIHNYWVMFISILFHIVVPLYFQPLSVVLKLLFAHGTMMGISYFANVAPNHDTHDTFKNHPAPRQPNGEPLDWGEQQVRCSGNHSTDGGVISTLVTHLWGGMNYQIEHHLFPAVSHTHMPEISKITKATALEFGIPYSDNHSWFSSLLNYGKLINLMSLLPYKATDRQIEECEKIVE